MQIRRVYVEKKREFAVKSKELLLETKEYLGIIFFILTILTGGT